MGEETGERGKSGSTLTGHLRYFLSFCGGKETQKDYCRMMEIVYRTNATLLSDQCPLGASAESNPFDHLLGGLPLFRQIEVACLF